MDCVTVIYIHTTSMHPQTTIRIQNRAGLSARLMTQEKDDAWPRATDRPRKIARPVGNNSRTIRCSSQGIGVLPAGT